MIILIFTNIFMGNALSEKNFFLDAKKNYDEKKYDESKFLFQRNIVFNPKDENSYLYLAKIFKQEKNDSLEENNLDTVLLLNPKNEEAIYLLTLLNIKNSNFLKAKELINTLNSVCEKMCSSKLELESKLNSSLKSE